MGRSPFGPVWVRNSPKILSFLICILLMVTSNQSCCFVLLTRGRGRLETRPPVAQGSSPELSAFTMSLAPPV